MAGSLLARRLFPSALSRSSLPSTSSAFLKQAPIASCCCFHTNSRMSEKQVEELKANPYFDKYADKIAKLQKTSPEEFLQRLNTVEENKGKEKKALAEGSSSSSSKDFPFPTKPKQEAKKEPSMVKEKSLNDMMKVELLTDKTKEEIASIWREYHSTKDAVSAVIPAETFKEMEKRFQEFKTFLFPVPRDQGYYFVVVQFEGKEAHFATLISYQAHMSNAPECLTLTHYTDLAEDKGIVLMSGEYDKNILSRDEASSLGVQLLLFYGSVGGGGDGDKKLAHLRRFTYETDDFNHLDLVAELEASRNVPLAPLFRGGGA